MNIKKVILYLFSTSLGEVLTIGSALALSLPIPLLPTQIIWLNLVTDGFLDVSLAMEPKEKGLLKKSARGKQQIFDRLMVVRMIIMAIPMALGTFFLFHFYLKEDLAKAWTISLTTLAVFQWFNAWNCRREEKSIFRTNFFSNKFLLAATVIVIVLQFTAVYSSLGHKILGTVPISVFEWTLIVAVASSIVFTEEFRKLIFRNFFKTAD